MLEVLVGPEVAAHPGMDDNPSPVASAEGDREASPSFLGD